MLVVVCAGNLNEANTYVHRHGEHGVRYRYASSAPSLIGVQHDAHVEVGTFRRRWDHTHILQALRGTP